MFPIENAQARIDVNPFGDNALKKNERKKVKKDLPIEQCSQKGKRDSECKICVISFTADKSNPRKHICDIDRGTKGHECEVCGKSFSLKGNLNRHLLIHKGIKSHDCEFCGKSFALKGNLTRHLLIHKGIKSYKC